tara:strand:+ start:2876 stop:2992 length:117 start_codon:yes stop_codon:yes gene_type:complete
VEFLFEVMAFPPAKKSFKLTPNKPPTARPLIWEPPVNE